MLEVATLLRDAYLLKLQPLAYNGVVIPSWDEYERGEAIINIGNSTKCQAYVLIHDITSSDESLKCGISQDVQIQMQIVTKFNANTGGSAISEAISSIALSLLIPNGQKINVTLNGVAYSWISRMISSRPINSETKTNKIFTRNYIFSHKISQ